MTNNRGPKHSTHVRLTGRGWMVFITLWLCVAWWLASVLPFWWTKF